MLCTPGIASAQEPSFCENPRADFGIRIRFTAGDFEDGPDGRTWVRFLTEPVVTEVEADGPARGALAVGDVLVSIGEDLITTRAGSRRFHFAGERAVALVLRREGRRVRAELAPVARCNDSPPSVQADAGPAHVAGLLGLHLRCQGCGLDRTGPDRTWRFGTSPVVVEVISDGPADRAGFQVGDVILSIDGQPLVERGGALRFSRLQPGASARLTVSRAGRRMQIDVRADPDRPR